MSGTTLTVCSKLPCLCGESTRRQALGLLFGGLCTTGKRQSCHRFLRGNVCIELVRGRWRVIQVKGLRLSTRMEFVGTGPRGGPLTGERLLTG